MWEGKTKAQIKSAKFLLVVVTLFLISVAFAGIGIDNSTPQYKRLFNNDANYWLSINGFQISNTPSEHQANMKLCFEAKCGFILIPKTCADSLAWNWFDNNTSEYARTISSYTISNIDLNILYALDSSDQNKTLIQPLIRNRSPFTCDVNVFYEQRDLNLNNDNNGDWVQFWKNGEQNYNLQGLNISAVNLDVNRVRIFDVVQLNDMILWWDSVKTKNDVNSILDYNLQIYQQAGQMFSPVSLKVQLGQIAPNTTAKFNMWWKDAKVPTAVTLMHPDSNASYDLNTNIKADCFVTIGGTGPAGSYVGRLQDCNNTTCSALQDMTTNQSNQVLTIIQGDANPLSTTTANVDLNWTLTGVQAGTRYVRCKVDSNLASGCRAAAPCYSTIRSITINPLSPDANVVKIDGNRTNIAMRKYNYYSDGNSTIDFNAFYDYNGIFFGVGRLDTNLNYRKVDTNVSTRIITDLNITRSKTIGSNIGLYCDDLNFAGGKDKNRYGVTCRWDWNAISIADGNYTIDVNITDNSSTRIKYGDFNFRIENRILNSPIDMNIVRPNGGEIIGVRDGNYRIDFNVSDKDWNGIFYGKGRLDANIDYNVGGGWKRIVTDLNLLATATAGSNKGIYCDDLNFAGGDVNKQVTCHYDWNLAVWREPSVDSKIDVNVTDNNGSTDTSRSANKFRLHNWLVSSSSTATAYNNSRKLVRNADGNRIYLVYEGAWTQNPSKDIWFTQSDNNGSTWSTPVNVSNNSGGSVFPAIDVNSTGGLNVVWADDVYGPVSAVYDIFYKSCPKDCNNSGNWSADVNLSSNNGVSAYPHIDINSTDGLIVTWEDNIIYTGGYDYDIIYKSCSIGCGNIANWSADVNISSNSTISNFSAFDINSTGGINLVWQETGIVPLVTEIFYKACSKNCESGSSWSADVNISQNSGSSDYPSLAISSDNKIHVVWADGTGGGIRAYYKNCSSNCNAAASWGNDFNVNDKNGTYPSIAFDSDNNIYVVWSDDNTSNNLDNINTRKRQSNGTWDANIIKTTDGNDNAYPNAAKTLLAGSPYEYLQYVYTRGLAADYNVVFGHEQAVALLTPFVNSVVDVNIVRPNGGEIIGVRDGNYRIDFNVHDNDCNGISFCTQRLDANIDYNVGGGWTRIVTDLNLLATATAGSNKGIYCDDLNFAGGDINKQVTCHYDWNLAVWREPSVDSKIDVNVTDNNGSTDTNRSANKFRLHNWLVSSSTTATAYNNSRKLVRNSDGSRIYLVYEANPADSSSRDVWFTQSDNNGSTWSTPVNVSNDTNISSLSAIDINSTDGLHIVWNDRSGFLNIIKYNSCPTNCNLSSNWGSPIILALIGDLPRTLPPAIDINSSNGLNVVFESSYDSSRINYKSCSKDCKNISNWSVDVNVNNSSGSYTPAIDINSTGGLHVVWYDVLNEIFYNSCSGDCGVAGNWSSEVNISSNSGVSDYPSIAISNDNKVHVVWNDNTSVPSSNVRYKNCSSNCGTATSWGNDFNVNDANGTFPTIAFDSDNNVYVVWMDDNAGITANKDNINTRKRNSNGSWDANIIKTTDGSDNAYPNTAKSLLAGAPYPYLQYVYTRGLAADYNIVFGHEQAVSIAAPANNAADANVVRVDGNRTNIAMAPKFDYYIDGNFSIDYNVLDKDWNGNFWGKGRIDVNIDARKVDTNVSTRIVTDLNITRAGYCDDANFSGVDMNATGTTCHWDWNAIAIADGNYTIDVNVTDANATSVKYGDFNLKVQNVMPNKPVDVNIVRPNGGEIVGVRDGNYRIDFNVSDKDCNGIFYCSGRLDANIDYNLNSNWTRIVTDLNLLATATVGSNTGVYCDDLNFAGGDINKQVTCHYDWNLAAWREPSVDSRIDVNVTDNNGSTDTNRSANKFRLHNWLVSSSSTATAYGNSRKLIRNADGGRIYLVYEAKPPESSSNDVWFSQSDNNGTTWSTPINVSNKGDSWNPTIDINSTGGLHIIWEMSDGIDASRDDIFYKSCSIDCNVAGNWGSEVRLTDVVGASVIGFPAIDIDSTNGLHVVYRTINFFSSASDIAYQSCSGNCDILGSWSGLLNISNSLSTSQYVAIDINSTDGLHIVWDDNSSGNNEILYKSCSISCGTLSNWSSDVNISNHLGSSQFPSLAISNDNKVHVAWHDNNYFTSNSILYRDCPGNCGAASSWGNDFNVNDANGTYPTIAFDSDNNVYVVWMDDNAGITANRDNINTRKRQSNGTWDANIIKTTDAVDNQYPNAAKTLLAGAPYDYLQYVYTRGLAADYNIVFGHEQAVALVPPPSNNLIDANIIKIDGNLDNQALPSFNYASDGNLTIDFNVQDLDYNGSLFGKGRFDANIDARDVNGTSIRIITDLNLMVSSRCDDLNFARTTTCHWDWNIMLITDRNVFIDLNVTDNNGSTDINSSDYNFRVTTYSPNKIPDANIVKIDGNLTSGAMPVFNYYIDGNLTIDFNVQDLDINGIGNLDVNLDYRKIDTNTSTRIVSDLNLMQGGFCDDTNFYNSTRCSWDWNVINVADGNYTIDINITDWTVTTIKYGDFNFDIKNRKVQLSTSPSEIIEDVWISGGTETRTLFITQDGNTITEDLNVYLTSGCPAGVLSIDKSSIASLNPNQSDFVIFTITPTGSKGVFKCSLRIENQYGGISVNVEIYDETTGAGQIGGGGPGEGGKKPPGIYVPPGSTIEVIEPTDGIRIEIVQGMVSTQKIVLKNISNKPINKIDFLASRGLDDMLTIESEDNFFSIDVNKTKTFYLKFSPASEMKTGDINGVILLIPDDNKAIAIQIFSSIKILQRTWINSALGLATLPILFGIDLRSIALLVGIILIFGIFDSKKRNVHSFVACLIIIGVVGFLWITFIHPLIFFFLLAVICLLLGWSYFFKKT